MGSDKSLAMQMDLVDVDIRICCEKKNDLWDQCTSVTHHNQIISQIIYTIFTYIHYTCTFEFQLRSESTRDNSNQNNRTKNVDVHNNYMIVRRTSRFYLQMNCHFNSTVTNKQIKIKWYKMFVHNALICTANAELYRDTEIFLFSSQSVCAILFIHFDERQWRTNEKRFHSGFCYCRLLCLFAPRHYSDATLFIHCEQICSFGCYASIPPTQTFCCWSEISLITTLASVRMVYIVICC